SPCIDAGINDVPVRTEMDIGGVDRLLDGNFDGTAIIDIGAFEYLPGDANYDGKINIMDLILIWGNVGKDPTSGALTQRADVNGDGVVNLEDMILARQRMMAR
ncbi:MAG TPA: dockerin type I repeat-containing protein, partial [Planctomycetota bacterium]|nr:dockerin type I repeat-containing protein [Planctomycetota bacterium]